ncbi:Beta-N-acetylglucosaminidase [Flavobacterium sp. 9AF]|uniref:glycoside hydrolase family 3 N-terminal domain-containing protein n=1 Tax=Flavobacterium sp. 9AF TaxID=2653142 RepID=UPI0012F05A9E|nr:glycoside hydrolase family 3 N-terminal domain-containing protein [Flavobacterium sp. 9AF]VXB62598.1 Beta-N-acetylglucosaminidase [Flavobacterium sp. 9AF]
MMFFINTILPMRYLFFFIFICQISVSQVSNRPTHEKWIDSIYNKLSFEEKVGQLFMVAAYSNKNEVHNKEIDELIEKYKVGGLIFFQGGPVRQAQLTNRYQSKANIPLFIGIDAEWGLSMRLDSTYRYPWNMTLGAIQDFKLIEKMGAQMGEQSKRMGIHFNFAPVVDINTNPNNPIIGNRSFGEDKINVTNAAIALTKGLQSQGVFATAKHFPGHGDTETDSHHTLPIVKFSKQRIDSIELYPYRELIKNDLASVMVAHLNVPSLESRKGYPTSISYNVITNILKNELHFEGLIFTDALNMKGASNFKKPGDIDLEAFLAGNDILLFAENVPVAIQKFTEAFKSGKLTEERLAYSVKKILKYKYLAGLNNYKPIALSNLYEDLNQSKYDAMNYSLYENAITALKNKDKIFPIKELEDQRIGFVKIGDGNADYFLNELRKYTAIQEIDITDMDKALEEMENFTKIIVGYHKEDGAWKNHNFDKNEIEILNKIAKENKVIVTIFAKPYSLLKIAKFSHFEGLILAYQNNNFSNTVAAETIFGAIGTKGKLPVSINKEFYVNDGIITKPLNILGFDAPESVGLDSKILSKIDSIANYAVSKKMTPGAQIVVARKGKVVYQKSFGYHTYDTILPVKNSDLYDVASLTKILSTLPNIMIQYDKGNINLKTKLKDMLPIFKNSNKANATFQDMLTHQARFQAWLPFYKETLDSLGKPSKLLYKEEFSEEFPIKVAENLFLIKTYNDTIIKRIADSELLRKATYKYSDFSFILMKEYLEKETGKTLDRLAYTNFYSKMGLTSMTYNPLNRFSKENIIPTEIDDYYRFQTIQGYVHDMGAAMQGGVAGHAGIFSNALDVAKMMQMYLQKGNYGNHQFVSEETFNAFNTCYYCKDKNRRGLGFDKPQLGEEGPTCGCVSMNSFGHTGFTGTMAWSDPESEIVYVFLSNRTYPEAKTNVLSRENIRENIQKVIYESIIN